MAGRARNIVGRGRVKPEQILPFYPTPLLVSPDEPIAPDQELLECHAAMSLDKQLTMQEVIADASWNVDLNAGTITFGTDRALPMQLLGSFSKESETWLWAWENERAPIPEAVVQQALQLRAFGEEHELEVFTIGCFDATLDDLLFIGTVAAGMFGSSAYYLGDYGAGMMLVTLESEEIDQHPTTDLTRIPSVFTQVIQAHEMRHRPAFLHYMAQKGYSPIEVGNAIRVDVSGGTITVMFDDLGRMTNIKAVST